MAGIDTRTLVERITDELRAQVIDGRLEPGRRVRQEEIAARLGVSRTPLREAFRRLEIEGWFQNHPRQGVVVATMTLAEVVQIAVTRLILEPAAAGLAATTHDDAAALRLCAGIAGDRGTAESSDFEGVNRDFHLEVYGLGSGVEPSELTRTTQAFWERFARYRRYYWRAEENRARSARAHQEIADAWCARDRELTEVLVARHISEAIFDQVDVLHPGADPDPALVQVCRRYGIEKPR